MEPRTTFGSPDAVTAEVLTAIYGEEDWSATIRKLDEDEEAAEDVVPDHHGPRLVRTDDVVSGL